MPNLPELKDLIAARLSVEEIFDILGWNMFDFVEAIESYIEDEHEAFEEACR